MRGFLTKIIQRQLRRIVLGAALGMFLATTSAVAANNVKVAKLDEAVLATEKAQVLLAATDCGAPGEKSTVVCETRMKRVLELLGRVREAIAGLATPASGRGAAGTARR
ncbi:MAG TPA: hypothetical protein VIK50_10975 [Gemmatimonadaceae bacterium]